MSDQKFNIVYDTELKAPACVLLQAGMGGDTAAFNRYFLRSEYWLLAPTPGMKLIAGTDEEWRMAVEITEKTWKGRNPNDER